MSFVALLFLAVPGVRATCFYASNDHLIVLQSNMWQTMLIAVIFWTFCIAEVSSMLAMRSLQQHTAVRAGSLRCLRLHRACCRSVPVSMTAATALQGMIPLQQ
jgi:Cu/Ag efflux pump CusA